jgi:hypothetical protein
MCAALSLREAYKSTVIDSSGLFELDKRRTRCTVPACLITEAVPDRPLARGVVWGWSHLGSHR